MGAKAMTLLDYDDETKARRNALYQIWIGLSRVDAALVVLGGDQDPTFVAVGKLLRADSIEGLPSDEPDYRSAYEHMGVVGLLLLATALMYQFAGGPFRAHCAFEHSLLARSLQASAEDVRELQAGPAGYLLPRVLPLEG